MAVTGLWDSNGGKKYCIRSMNDELEIIVNLGIDRFEASRADFGVKNRKKWKCFKIDFLTLWAVLGPLRVVLRPLEPILGSKPETIENFSKNIFLTFWADRFTKKMKKERFQHKLFTVWKKILALNWEHSSMEFSVTLRFYSCRKLFTKHVAFF